MGQAVALLSFKEGYIERMWGGEKLRALYGKQTPSDAPIGEAWMIAISRVMVRRNGGTSKPAGTSSARTLTARALHRSPGAARARRVS